MSRAANFIVMKKVKSRCGTVLPMNTWTDVCESQQQKLNLILKDHSSKSSAKYGVSLMIVFVKENY
jgi:hypothetical protein